MNDDTSDTAGAADATPDPEERKKAIAYVLYALRNPLVILSLPMREEALALADAYDITAADLLTASIRRAKST
jgi:hypothetical protein